MLTARPLPTLLALALLAPLAACVQAPSPTTAPNATTIEATHFNANLGIDLTQSTKTSKGDYYRDLVAGTGGTIALGQTLSVTYAGFLADGTLFDHGSFQFQIGVTSLIDGWVDCLVGAKVGATRQLVLTPAESYGDAGNPPLIPGGAILVFNVQINSSP